MRRAMPTEMMVVGNSTVPWIVCSFGPYHPDDVKTVYNKSPIPMPAAVEKRYEEAKRDVKRRESKGESVPFNGLGYQLERFSTVGRAGDEERPVLTMAFRPTDYFRMLVTDQRLDDEIIIDGQVTTLRRHYAQRTDLKVAPVPEFATHFGVGLAIVTRDQRLVISERGHTAVDSFVLFPSVAEGSSRPVDGGDKGGADPYRTAVRGVAEEMGIEVSRDDVRFLSFGVNVHLCEYALLGVVEVPQSEREILEIRSLGIPKDQWENRRLHFVDFNPKAVAGFATTSNLRWSPFAVATFIHALVDGHGHESTLQAFRNVTLRLSQEVPPGYGKA